MSPVRVIVNCPGSAGSPAAASEAVIDTTGNGATSSLVNVTVARFGLPMVYAELASIVSVTVSLASIAVSSVTVP